MSRARLSRRRRWSVYLIGLGLWASGALWLVAHYLWQKPGDYGPVTSPAEPWALDVHGGFAMAGLWLAGLIWAVHVPAGWHARRGRWSGGLLLGVVLVLAVSGYLLYYLGDEDWRGRASRVHWILGLAMLPVFLVHRFKPKPAPARPRAVRRGSSAISR